jgi:pyruvate-ferredoxin/flavodoxin oxidoreductase
LLEIAKEGGIFLLNTPYPKEEVWNRLPRVTQERIIEKKLKFYAIDAYKVAHASNMGRRINTVMQTCFFAISGILSKEEAMAKIKGSIQKTYGSKGDVIVQMNYAAVDATLENLYEIDVPASADSYSNSKQPSKGICLNLPAR